MVGWPRPPLVLGFILGPVIESNLWPAVQIWGVLGILSRPVTLALAIFGVASAFYLTWMMGSVSEVENNLREADTASANDATKTPSRSARGRSFKFVWHNEVLFSLALLLVSIWAMRETQNLPPRRAAFYPPGF
jgi:ABC-type multidrug transport system fused ATPase/permease subunit